MLTIILTLALASAADSPAKAKISEADRMKALELSNEMYRARAARDGVIDTIKKLQAMQEARERVASDAYETFVKATAKRLGYEDGCVLDAKLETFVKVKDNKSAPCPLNVKKQTGPDNK